MVPDRSPKSDWYKVSVETLQGWGILLLLLVLAVTGYFGYRWWESSALQREAARVLQEDRRLFQQLQGSQDLQEFQAEYDTAWELMEQGRFAYDAGEYADALARGRRSRELLTSIRDATARQGAGQARFVTVDGRVDYRRGERGRWESARPQLTLENGDFVKTAAGGTAEIMFVDGTMYTVRPNTLFVVSGARGDGPGDRTVELQYGWINLNTAQRPSQIATPRAEARVEDETEAVVVVDETGERGSFTTYRGSMDVASAAGDRQRVEALQTVSQQGERLSEPLQLPPAPELTAPGDNADIDSGRVRRITLRWQTVDEAHRYALQVSRNRLFVENVIEADDRRGTEANLGIRGEGSFLWRVAAQNAAGLRGPWSEPRRFRVAPEGPEGGDREPPELLIDDVQSYGAIFIVRGRTEPGSSVWVNGESVTVAADGGFTKTVQLVQTGWDFIEVRAADPWGNEVTKRERVFVENI